MLCAMLIQFSDNKAIQFRAVIASEAKQSISSFMRRDGLLRFARNDVALIPKIPNAASRPRGAKRPSRAFIFRPLGGRGECRVPAAPAASCALFIGRTHTSNNEYTGIARHSRTQWFLRRMSRSPRLLVCFATVGSGYVLSKPGRADLTPRT